MMFSPYSERPRWLPDLKPSPRPISRSREPTPQAMPNMVRNERSLCAQKVAKICAKMSITICMGLITRERGSSAQLSAVSSQLSVSAGSIIRIASRGDGVHQQSFGPLENGIQQGRGFLAWAWLSGSVAGLAAADTPNVSGHYGPKTIFSIPDMALHRPCARFLFVVPAV